MSCLTVRIVPSMNQIRVYSEINFPPARLNIVFFGGVKCSNANCQNHSHTADLETFYDEVIDVLSKSVGKIIKQVPGKRNIFHTWL